MTTTHLRSLGVGRHRRDYEGVSAHLPQSLALTERPQPERLVARARDRSVRTKGKWMMVLFGVVGISRSSNSVHLLQH